MKKPRAHGANQDFVRRLEQMLSGLWPMQATLEQELATKIRSQEARGKDRNQWIEKFAIDHAPDISLKSIARLRKNLPTVFSPGLNQRIEQAHAVKVPFFTWLFGGAARYRARIAEDTLTFLRFRIKDTLQYEPREGLLQALGKIEKDASAQTVAADKIKARLESVKQQIKWVTEMMQTYGRAGAPKPDQKVVEAVTRGNTTLHQHNSSSRTRRATREDDDDFWRTIILYEVLTHDSRHHRDDRDFQGRGGSFGGGGASSEYTPEPERAPRVNDGHASTRMADAEPKEDGRASTRMSEAAPIIANPFEDSRPARSEEPGPTRSSDEGRASVRMSDATPSYPDRNESGSGTSY